MATPDKKRTSSRKFNIEKRGSYSFDLEKEEVAPVPDPSTPDITSNVGANPQDSENLNPDKPKSSNGKIWIGVLTAVVVAALAIWLIPKGCSNGEQKDTLPIALPDSVEVAEIVETNEVSQDSVWNDEGEYVVKNVAVEHDSDSDVESASATTTTPASSNQVESPESTGPVTPVPVSSATNTPRSVPVSTTNSVGTDVDQEALKVIRGVYGDGLERKQKLGANYQEIQNRVNQLKREGVF